MLPDFGEHTPYVWAAFGLSFLLLLGLTGYSIWRARAAETRLEEVRAALKDLEASNTEGTAE